MGLPRFVRSETALWHRTSGRTLVNPGEGRDTIELTGVAALVWDVLGEPAAADELAVDLAEAFSHDVATVGPQVEGLLAGLLAIGAVRQMP